MINHCKKYPKVKCVANMSIDKNHGPERNKQVKKKIEQAWDAGISVVALAPAGSRTCKDAYGSSPKVISVGHVKEWDKKQGAYGNCVTVYGSASKRDNAVGRKFYCHCCKNHYYALGVLVVMMFHSPVIVVVSQKILSLLSLSSSSSLTIFRCYWDCCKHPWQIQEGATR